MTQLIYLIGDTTISFHKTVFPERVLTKNFSMLLF